MSEPNPNVGRFMRLFQGLNSAYGTGAGGWVHEPPTRRQFSTHLAGRGKGLGIAPLRSDGTVTFAAIDLDEPNFELAKELAAMLPGSKFIEKSRSGNAHILVFFDKPIEAWVPRGIMREALAAIGRNSVEVFPKQDRLRIGMVGNYLNLCYHGDDRPILVDGNPNNPMKLAEFLDQAEATLNNPDDWHKRSRWLGLAPPEDRETSAQPFGEQKNLHMCASHVIEQRDENPVVEGYRAVVFFTLAKQLANCEQFDHEEALSLMGLVNDSSPDPITEGEIKRIYWNAVHGQFTSTGCDQDLFAPYAHPDCPIAHPEKRKK